MSSLGNYIISRLASNEYDIRNIATEIRMQRSFNRKIVLAAVAMAAYVYIDQKTEKNQGRTIKELQKRIEEIEAKGD